MDKTKFRRGYLLAERMWKDGGVTEERIGATLLKLLEDNDPEELLGFQTRIASFALAASAANKGVKH